MSLSCTIFEILTLINLRIRGSADPQINAIATPTLADIAPRLLASSCDKQCVVASKSVDSASSDGLTLDRNEINKIAQAHRVAETGRPAGGRRPAGLQQ